jgi:hypothetical protein
LASTLLDLGQRARLGVYGPLLEGGAFGVGRMARISCSAIQTDGIAKTALLFGAHGGAAFGAKRAVTLRVPERAHAVAAWRVVVYETGGTHSPERFASLA